MTHQQEEEWADNPNTYVADEEDATCTARVSGELLLDELCRVSSRRQEMGGGGRPLAHAAGWARHLHTCTVVGVHVGALLLAQSHGLPAVLVTLEAVEKAIGQAEQARAAAAAQQQGQPAAAAAAGWWKLREAALLATGTVADALEDALSEGGGWQQLEAQVAGGPRGGRGRGRGSAAPTAAQAKGRLQALLDQILQQDLQVGRACLLASRHQHAHAGGRCAGGDVTCGAAHVTCCRALRPTRSWRGGRCGRRPSWPAS